MVNDMPKDNTSDWDCECDWEDDNDFCDYCFPSRITERKKLLKIEASEVTSGEINVATNRKRIHQLL